MKGNRRGDGVLLFRGYKTLNDHYDLLADDLGKKWRFWIFLVCSITDDVLVFCSFLVHVYCYDYCYESCEDE